MAEGFWILLAPLSAGQHTIQFHGEAVFGTFTFEEGVTYNFNYTQKKPIAGLPILPVLGFRGDF